MTDDWKWTPPEPQPPAAQEPAEDAGAPAPAAPDPPVADPPPPPEPPAYESSIPLRFHTEEAAPAEPAAEAPVEEPHEAPVPEPTSWLHPHPVEPVGLEGDTPRAEEEPPSLAANADLPPALPEYLHPPSTMTGHGMTSVVEAEKPFRELAFDITALTDEQRTHLYARLAESQVAVRIEEDRTVYGRIEDASVIEGYIADLSGSQDVEEVIDEADADDDEIVFDMSSLSLEERRHLSMRLTGAGITHLWEVGSDLVVSVGDAQVVERFAQEVRNPDGFGDEEIASFEESGDVDDEDVYAAMSGLYVAADKLAQKPGDEATAGEFYLAVDDVDGLPAPFGLDPRVWSQVQELANRIADQLDAEAETSAIGADAKVLRQLLVNYV